MLQDGGTALIVASQCGHQDIVGELLSRGADIHCMMRDRATAVFVAAQNGHSSVLRLLLKKNARANVKRADGSSPLWIAAQMGHSDAVKILLDHGSAPDTPRHVSIIWKPSFINDKNDSFGTNSIKYKRWPIFVIRFS